MVIYSYAQFWEFKYNENTKKSTEFNNEADDEKKKEKGQERDWRKERREQTEKKKSEKKGGNKREERNGENIFFLMGNYTCLFSATQFREDLFIHSSKSYLLNDFYMPGTVL